MFLDNAVLQVTEVIHDDGSPTEKTFEHVPTEIGAEEAEEVGGGCDMISWCLGTSPPDLPAARVPDMMIPRWVWSTC